MKKYLIAAVLFFTLLPVLHTVNVSAAEEPDQPLNGWVKEEKKTFYYNDGKAVKGWQKIHKKWYFFDKKTKALKKNCIAGDKAGGWYYVDEDGVRCGNKTMKLAVKAVRKYSKAKDKPVKRLYSCFRYFVKNYRYRSGGYKVSAKELPSFAKEFLLTKGGNCYRGAAALAYCAKALGYEARIGVGGKSKKEIVHGWTEVKIGKKWYYYDINRQRMNSHMKMYKLSVKKKPFGLVKNKDWDLTVSSGKVKWK